MKRYIYLSLIPEALIASMLPPEDFGSYIATGTKKRTRGQAMFFEIDQEVISDMLPWDYIEKRCVPQEEGRPKSSVYLSIYRVLESLPLNAFMNLYLTTDDGRTLGLTTGEYKEDEQQDFHLYQEWSPINPRIVSTQAPKEFLEAMTGGVEKFSIPRLVFSELKLNGLAHDPLNAPIGDLPYRNVDHLRDCLMILRNEPGKTKKTIMRFLNRDLPYRTIKNGFFIGDKDNMLFYPFPSQEELESEHYAWWRSAKLVGFE